MRIESVHIENYRSFRDQTLLLGDYTCLVGANGAGKSTVLAALSVFFRDNHGGALDVSSLTEKDFHSEATERPIRITVTFRNLTAAAREDLAAYVRQDRLIVRAEATWDASLGRADVRQYGERLGLAAFQPFREADKSGASAVELKKQYEELRAEHGDLPAWQSKVTAHAALRAYENDRPDQCVAIPSEDQFYGFTKGTNRLAPHVQWVLVPAVKDASTEEAETKLSALGALLERTVRRSSNLGTELAKLREETAGRYDQLVTAHAGDLTALGRRLDSSLKTWAHPQATLDLRWARDAERAVKLEAPAAEVAAGERGFSGGLARFGHGLQRSFLIALLQELAVGDTEGPTLILACEEPELYQHPPQARHLADVLETLSGNNAQVLVCTHSPYFVRGNAFDAVRVVRRAATGGESVVASASATQVYKSAHAALGEPDSNQVDGMVAKLHQQLQCHINEMFFAPIVVLVEGFEDVAYITAYMHHLGLWEAFRKLHCHMVPAGGKSEIVRPLAAAKLLGIPAFVVFDGDMHQPDRGGSRAKHEKDNRALLRLCGADESAATVEQTVWFGCGVMWCSEIGTVFVDDIGLNEHTAIRERLLRTFGGVGGLEKNSLFIAEMIRATFDEGHESPSLKQVCESILAFAGNRPGSPHAVR